MLSSSNFSQNAVSIEYFFNHNNKLFKLINKKFQFFFSSNTHKLKVFNITYKVKFIYYINNLIILLEHR